MLLPGCKKQDDDRVDIPYVYVSFSINPNSTQYQGLNAVSGHEYLTGGYRGILAYRAGIEEFNAFERACPYDHYVSADAYVDVEESGITARCPVCGSRFLLLDGTPFEGPSPYSLLSYATVYDGVYLYVSN